jgi:hypothetical protein
VDHLRRLTWFSIGFCAVWLWAISTAYAQSVPATAEYQPKNSGWSQTGGGFAQCLQAGPFSLATVTAACAAYGNCWIAANGLSGSISNPVFNNGTCSGVYGGNTYGFPNFVEVLSCPSGYTDTGNTGAQACVRFTCPSGYTGPDGSNMCTPLSCNGQQQSLGGVCSCQHVAGQVDFDRVATPRSSTQNAWPAPMTGFCLNGCQARLSPAGASPTHWFWVATYSNPAVTCGALPLPSGLPGPDSTPNNPGDNAGEVGGDTPEGKCIKSGGTPGSVNGQFRCLDRADTPGDTLQCVDSVQESTANGQRTTTTTRTCVRCNNGNCTTTRDVTSTVTPVDANGTPTGPGVPGPGSTESRPGDATGSGPGGAGQGSDFCRLNPDHAMCRTSRWGGACAAGFTCDGDAVQCAIAREQHIRNCELLSGVSGTTKGTAENRYRDALDGKGLPADFVKNNVIQASALNTGERINAGSCPAPVAFNTPLGSFTLDTTALCEPARWFGFVILFTSILIAVRITLQGLA